MKSEQTDRWNLRRHLQLAKRLSRIRLKKPGPVEWFRALLKATNSIGGDGCTSNKAVVWVNL